MRSCKINPNHRMPAMVDHEPKGGGGPISVFESGAIMMYIAEKAGKFWPQDVRAKYEVTQWVMWQMANQGPKLGRVRPFPPARRPRGRSILCGAPLHRRGEPPLRRAQQPALRPPLSGRRRVHDRRHDRLSLDRELEGAGPGHRGVQVFQALVRGDGQTAGRAEGHGGRCRPVERRHASCRPRSRSGSARCSTISAPGR